MSQASDVKTVAYLGPKGTYTEQAAIAYAPHSPRRAYKTLQDVILSVQNNDAYQAVVPIENSVVGSVIDSLDLLIRTSNVFIVSEILLFIDIALIASEPIPIKNVQVVRSKPEAFGQCQNFIRNNMPEVVFEPYSSTASAVASLKTTDSKTVAALGPIRAAQIHNTTVLKQAIQDTRNNITRFVAVSSQGIVPPTGFDKTSFSFEFIEEDKHGQLLQVLQIFALNEINLTKIESRPTGKALGKYYFIIDFEGHIQDKNIKLVFDSLYQLENLLIKKIIGSFPKAKSVIS